MSKSQKKSFLIGGLFAIVIVMAVAYAAFASNLTITGTGSTTNNWGVRIVSITPDKNAGGTSPNYTSSGSISAQKTDDLSATFNAALVSPGDSVTYTIVVENFGGLDAKLDSITMPESSNPAISFSKAGIAVGDVITAGQTGNTKTFTVTVTYVDSPNQGQPASTTSNFTLALNFVQNDGNGSSGGGGSSNTITMGGQSIEIVTEDDGLYTDSSEGTTRYIYKGKNNVNNYIYIKENGTNVKYRIYSIESDGTVKVIRDESIISMNFDDGGATSRKTEYCEYSGIYIGCNAWAAMDSFTNGDVTGEVKGLNGNSGDSSIKEYIDGTYAQMIDTTKIVTKTWNISGTEYNRDTLANAIADEKKSTWNGKIALLTASEYVRANTNTASCGTFALLYNNPKTCKSTNYLFKTSHWWFLSPSSSNRRTALVASSNSSVWSRNLNNGGGVRPSFYLCSGLTYSGKGTSSEPYEISGGSCSS